MEFKKISLREIVLVSVAFLLIGITFIANGKPKVTLTPHEEIQSQVVALPVLKRQENIEHVISEDETQQKQMKEQMDRDRDQQRQIKMLKMQLEQINLQLDNEKALTEINKLKKENAGYVKDSSSQSAEGLPSVRIVYIGGGDDEKRAILSIDGTSYSVKANDKPIASVQVLDITDQGVKLHYSSPQEMTTVINYVQE